MAELFSPKSIFKAGKNAPKMKGKIKMAINDSDKAALKWIFKASKKQRLRLVLLMAGNGVFAVVSVVFALMCRGIVDGAAQKNPDAVTESGIGLFLIIIAMLLLRLVCNNLDEIIRAGLEQDLRSRTLSAVLKKDYGKASEYHSGELLNRMFSDISIVTDGFAGLLPSLVNMLVRLIGAAVVLMTLDLSFTLLFIGAGTVLFLVSRFFRKRIKHLHKNVQETSGVVRSFLQETLESLLIVKVFGVGDKMCRINDKNQQNHYKARMKRRTVSILANSGFGFVFQMGYLYAIVWGAFKILDGAMTYGTLTAILQLVNQIQQPFASLSALLPRFFGMTASAERIMELEALPDEKAPERELDYGSFRSIKTENMSFSYGENKVLTDVDIEIKKGEFVSLTGISGGGKSTLFLLLLGVYNPEKGKISFASESESYSPGGETRGLFAYVPQGNFLFSGTVRDNITFLNETASEDEIKAAAEAACALSFIEELPDKMDTKIGENGFGISEGQAQRIAVARALLSGAPILLLDEATSALDEITEARLLKNIAEIKDKTVLIVTHRRAALDICGKHLILKEGRITYGEL